MAAEFDGFKKLASMRLKLHEKQKLFQALLADSELRPIPEVEDTELVTLLGEWDDEGQEYFERRHEIIGLKSGFTSIDRMVMGFVGGQVTIIGARTSHGKTQFVVNIAWRLALAGKQVMYVTLEDTKRQLNGRFQLIGKQPLKNLPIMVQRPERLDVAALDKIMALASTNRCELVIVDHLHYLVPRGDNQANVVGEISRQVKSMAKQYDLPVLMPAQMNREGSKSDDLSMYHIKDSGYVEQDADVVLLLQRGDPDGKSDLAPNELLVKMVKNRTRGMNGLRSTILKVGEDGMTLVEPISVFPARKI